VNCSVCERTWNSSPDIGLQVSVLNGTVQPSISRCPDRDSKHSSAENALLALLFGPDFSVIFLGVWGISGITERLSFSQQNATRCYICRHVEFMSVHIVLAENIRCEYDLRQARNCDVRRLHWRTLQIVQPCTIWGFRKTEEDLKLLGRDCIVLVYSYPRFCGASCLRLQGSPKIIPDSKSFESVDAQ
jgi:hypothetical protein